ncbi:hypothetical protein [Shewanella cyperi]|uniref:hypothetical protein n=1 Tax=Shewanella cyperi TaxID=2814292 RepID=UPI001A9522C6|nr:hypothetical protein [Shewanella cyperi]QSX41374.1 hypothetical protein JYB84_02750 [Shewanella cyperi]
MTKLNIEHVDIKKDYSHILVNNINYCVESYCYGEKILYVYDEKLFDALSEYEVRDLFKFFYRISIVIEVVDDFNLNVQIEPKDYQETKDYWASAVLNFEIEEWDKPWSVKQYFYNLLEKVESISNAQISCDIYDYEKHTGEPIYDLYNGIGINLPIEDVSVTLKSIYSEVSNLILTIHKEVESDFIFNTKQRTVERSIHFTPEYYQAGLNILSYFGTYLREQYPEENASVKIEQNGLKVRMVIESEDGQTETVEKALHEYELIITGAKQPASILSNDKIILELKNELRIAQFRIESQKDLIGMQNGRIDQLLNIIGDGLSQKNRLMVDFKPNITLSNNLSINQNIAAALSNINELMNELPNSNDAYFELNELKKSLTTIESDNNPEAVRRSPVMSKFKRLIDRATEHGTDLNNTIKSIESGWEILCELAKKYNKVAEWCGLPVIPSTLIK